MRSGEGGAVYRGRKEETIKFFSKKAGDFGGWDVRWREEALHACSREMVLPDVRGACEYEGMVLEELDDLEYKPKQPYLWEKFKMRFHEKPHYDIE